MKFGYMTVQSMGHINHPQNLIMIFPCLIKNEIYVLLPKKQQCNNTMANFYTSTRKTFHMSGISYVMWVFIAVLIENVYLCLHLQNLKFVIVTKQRFNSLHMSLMLSSTVAHFMLTQNNFMLYGIIVSSYYVVPL